MSWEARDWDFVPCVPSGSDRGCDSVPGCALDCAVRVSTPCEGRAELDVFVGNRRVHHAKPIESAEQTCRFGLAYQNWEVELDPERDLLYDTAVFRAELRQTCGLEPPYLLRTDDSFVAGFAEGE